jgi:hypothetical protein
MTSRARAVFWLVFAVAAGTLLFAAPVAAAALGDAIGGGGLTPEAVLTMSGASIVVSIAVGALFSAIGWTDAQGGGAQKDRFGPLVAILVGTVLVGGLAALQGADVLSAVLTGFMAGYGSMGVHDLVGVATG